MWGAGKLKKFPFNTPMAWHEQKNHVDDCYFCAVNVRGFNRKNAHRINNPNLSSAIQDEELILNIEAAKSNSDTNDNCTTESEDDNYEDNLDNNKINQAQLDYF